MDLRFYCRGTIVSDRWDKPKCGAVSTPVTRDKIEIARSKVQQRIMDRAACDDVLPTEVREAAATANWLRFQMECGENGMTAFTEECLYWDAPEDESCAL